MARAAFVMDRFMSRVGLHGKSFIPLLIGFGCTVPAILATRTLETRRDRLITMLVLPLMSCGARLPIYALIIPAFFAARWQGPVLWVIYLTGIVLALVGAKLLRQTLFRGETTPFVMELPPYRMPTAGSLADPVWHTRLAVPEEGRHRHPRRLDHPVVPDQLPEAARRRPRRRRVCAGRGRPPPLARRPATTRAEAMQYSSRRSGRPRAGAGAAAPGLRLAHRHGPDRRLRGQGSLRRADGHRRCGRRRGRDFAGAAHALQRNYSPLVGFCIMLFA